MSEKIVIPESELLKLARDGVFAEIKEECEYVAKDGVCHENIVRLKLLIQQLDIIFAAVDELRHRKEGE